MITKNECAFLSRATLGFLTIFFAILTLGWNWILATAIVYPMLGITSFFIHATRLNIQKLSAKGIFFLLLSPSIGPVPLLYSALQKKE